MAIAFNNQNNSIGLGSVSSGGFTTSITVNSIGVGIGTTNPTAKLWVNGDGYFAGVVTATKFFGQLDATSSLAQSVGFASKAGIATYTSEWILDAVGSLDYTFTGPGFTGAVSDPTLYLVRGQQYKFTNTMGMHPFRIQSTPNGSNPANSGTQYNDGIVGNDVSNGTLTWNVQFNAPGLLYYQCTAHSGMGGKIYIIDAGIGPDISINTTGIITASSFVGGVSNGVVIKSDGSNGIVTSANPGLSTVTYYGDGSKLSGINAAGSVSISTNTTNQDQYLTYVTGTGSTTGFGITTTGLVFNPSSGNLGIGTTNPTSKLWVSGAGYFIGSVTSEEGFYVNGELIGNSILGTNIVGTSLSISGISNLGETRIRSSNKLKFGGTGAASNFYIQYNSNTGSLDFVAQ